MLLTGEALRRIALALALVAALFVCASAQNESTAQRVSIKNFGQMDERFYRGAQPREEEFKELAALGIRTVIDLRDDPKDFEKAAVESLGMKYVNIPMLGKKYPTEEAVQSFLKVVNDPATGSFFVHCAGGRHRTGAMGAVYRFQFYNWTFEQVYEEMKKYDFYTSWGHAAFKDFVQDYYARMQSARANTQAAAATLARADTTTTSAAAATPARGVTTASVTVDAIPRTDSVASRKQD